MKYFYVLVLEKKMGFYKALFNITSFLTKILAFVTFITRIHDYINCEDIISCEISNFSELLWQFKEVKNFLCSIVSTTNNLFIGFVIKIKRLKQLIV